MKKLLIILFLFLTSCSNISKNKDEDIGTVLSYKDMGNKVTVTIISNQGMLPVQKLEFKKEEIMLLDKVTTGGELYHCPSGYYVIRKN